MYSVIKILINKERCFMFKMKKLASIAAAAAMTATAMTGLVSTASADDLVINNVFKSEDITLEGNGGRKNGAENITFQNETISAEKYDYLGIDPSSKVAKGTPTLTATLASGTYSLYYLSKNPKEDSHEIENIEFYNGSEKIDGVSYESLGVSEIENGLNGNSNLYAHRFLFTLNEEFDGTIKFVNTTKWLPDLYSVKITNDPANVIDFGSVKDSDNTKTLILGNDSIIKGTGSFKSDNKYVKISEGLTQSSDGNAILRYPYVNLAGMVLTKAEVDVGINCEANVKLRIGSTEIESKEITPNSGNWTVQEKAISFEDLKNANVEGYVELEISDSKSDYKYAGNYGNITLTYKEIEEPEPSATPSCTYSIDIEAENDEEGNWATGVGAAVKLNGSGANSFKWTITKDNEKMEATYNAAKLSGDMEYLIGLVVPMAVTAENVSSEITFSAE